MTENLLSCPFCGGEVKIDMLDSENSRNVKIYSAVHCPKCHEWFFKGLSKEKTVAAWNRRAQPENKPLTCEGCESHGEYENEVEYGYPSPCTDCARRSIDNYRYKPECEYSINY